MSDEPGSAVVEGGTTGRSGQAVPKRERERLVVIGNGMAGARFVEELVARGGRNRFEIVMFGDEPYGNYNRILLSNVLAGIQDPKDIFINPLSWYEDNGVRLHAGVRVASIDRRSKIVRGASGVAEAYDKLVIATGSRAFVPRIEGLEREGGGYKSGVFVFRTLDDCSGILEHAKRSRRAAVIGGGLLGLEAARGLLGLGLEVHVVHLMKHLMEVQLDAAGGAVLRRALEDMGLAVHLEKSTREILGDERVEGLRFEDGSELACDLVVISAGIRPNAELARDAGLTVERGIVVGDDLCSPDDPDIHALGECVQHRGRTYGLVAPLWEQAQILADRLTERRPDAAYAGSKISTKLKVMGVDLLVMGEQRAASDAEEEVAYAEPSRGIYRKLVIRDGTLAGAILLGGGAPGGRLLQAFERGLKIPEDRAALLSAGAHAGAGEPSVGDMPDEAQVCNCNGVSKGQIAAAARGGCRTLRQACAATRAGSGCGACKPQVQAVLELVLGSDAAEDPSAHYYVPGVPYAKPELVRLIKERGLRSVSSVFRELAGGQEDLASKPGLASLLKSIWGREYEDERDARFINDRVHANIQRDGTFSVIPRIYGGVTTPAQLRKIADVAERYEARMVKITGGQRIDLLGIEKERLPDVWRDLGMPSGHAYTKGFRTCKTCVGSEFCRYGVGDSTALGIAIERRFQGFEAPHKLKLAIAGCPRNCSEATTKDVGAVAIEGGRWEIYVGGGAGSRVRKGDLLCVVDTQEEVIRYAGRFMQYYREQARYMERSYDFVERVGIERVRRVIVDDAEGVAARLDAEVQASVDAYADPWSEADSPIHPSQFTTLLPPPSGAPAQAE
ncbi:nitrite reductase large subunit NirB [Sorangium atrum]|uniref:Nitrite reductase large subunit NirB n=1 Tax=Sorangium atrum TaxID=2995308 RepID=A0ABT5BW24_9BACT|nr:nitrite reductase large subunit NirB [Sorangium aterium]MDC0677898.1 nitrite reductase large subunit NirB [Sorangium aterium]